MSAPALPPRINSAPAASIPNRTQVKAPPAKPSHEPTGISFAPPQETTPQIVDRNKVKTNIPVADFEPIGLPVKARDNMQAPTPATDINPVKNLQESARSEARAEVEKMLTSFLGPESIATGLKSTPGGGGFSAIRESNPRWPNNETLERLTDAQLSGDKVQLRELLGSLPSRPGAPSLMQPGQAQQAQRQPPQP